MKKIKDLEDFGEKMDEAATPEKAKMRFEISTNLRKVTKIQKALIDVQQLLTEMSDEIIALNLTYSNLDSDSKNILVNMKYNIDNMLLSIKGEHKEGTLTGMADNSQRLQRNLERLKHGFIKKTNKG
jgi:hypothetical protein